MNCILRKWRLSDAMDLAAALNNEKIMDIAKVFGVTVEELFAFIDS